MLDSVIAFLNKTDFPKLTYLSPSSSEFGNHHHHRCCRIGHLPYRQRKTPSSTSSLLLLLLVLVLVLLLLLLLLLLILLPLIISFCFGHLQKETIESIAKFMSYVHTSVNQTSLLYLQNDRRYNYTTPKSFLEQVCKLCRESISSNSLNVQNH